MNTNSFEQALRRIKDEKKLVLLSNTHFESRNRLLKWYKKNVIFRLDFEIGKEEIGVNFLKDYCYLPFPKIVEWFHRCLPNFPYLARIKWENLGKLPLSLSEEEYMSKIKNILSKLMI